MENSDEIMFIPDGNSAEDYKMRVKIIRDFYRQWKEKNPKQMVFNPSLNSFINIRHVSIDETSSKAAKSYLSTLAVLQLDIILVAAKKCKVAKIKPNVANQQGFKEMIIMNCDLVSIGCVKLTVGVQKRSMEKVQYCITAINIGK